MGCLRNECEGGPNSPGSVSLRSFLSNKVVCWRARLLWQRHRLLQRLPREPTWGCPFPRCASPPPSLLHPHILRLTDSAIFPQLRFLPGPLQPRIPRAAHLPRLCRRLRPPGHPRHQRPAGGPHGWARAGSGSLPAHALQPTATARCPLGFSSLLPRQAACPRCSQALRPSGCFPPSASATLHTVPSSIHTTTPMLAPQPQDSPPPPKPPTPPTYIFTL
jgi:hypothetical protein